MSAALVSPADNGIFTVAKTYFSLIEEDKDKMCIRDRSFITRTQNIVNNSMLYATIYWRIFNGSLAAKILSKSANHVTNQFFPIYSIDTNKKKNTCHQRLLTNYLFIFLQYFKWSGVKQVKIYCGKTGTSDIWDGMFEIMLRYYLQYCYNCLLIFVWYSGCLLYTSRCV